MREIAFTRLPLISNGFTGRLPMIDAGRAALRRGDGAQVSMGRHHFSSPSLALIAMMLCADFDAMSLAISLRHRRNDMRDYSAPRSIPALWPAHAFALGHHKESHTK